jgi:hypothetical protein
MYEFMKFRKQFEGIAKNQVQKAKEREMICNVISYDSTTKKATVDLVASGLIIDSLIDVTAGDRVRVRYKNKYNIVLVSRA